MDSVACYNQRGIGYVCFTGRVRKKGWDEGKRKMYVIASKVIVMCIVWGWGGTPREERERKGMSCADHGEWDIVVDEVEYLFNSR